MNIANEEKQLEMTMLSSRESCLMHQLFGGKLTEADAHILFDGLDLDTANQNYLLLLACLGHREGWERFPAEMIPRLKGVHRYHQVHNAMGLPWFIRQLRKLTDAGIPIMLIKGIGLLAYYVPNMPRLMWDYDIAVPEEQFDKSLKLLTDENAFRQEWPHSATIKGSRDEIDLHRWIFKTHGEKLSAIWKRAHAFSFHGIEVYVPAPEDMFVHLLDTQSRNYFRLEGTERRMQWLHDCRSVWECAGGFDLDSIVSRAKEFHAKARVRMMLRIFMQCFPELIGKEEFDRVFPYTNEYEHLLYYGGRYKAVRAKQLYEGYTKQKGMTPLHIWQCLRTEMAQYRYLKSELRKINSKASFISYLNMNYCIDGAAAFVRRFILPIRLFEPHLGGGE